SAGNGNVYIQNVFSQKYLDDPGSSTSNGTAIIQYDFNGGLNQQWRLLPVNDGSNFHYVIQNASSGLVLDDANFSTDDGTGLIQYQYNGGANQVWGFGPAGSAS
ncbi:MAG: RICIN domain-containing protein, partial [Planctomycetaceae bacterium]|nr:RICIN domain-containing protein [Planctomycetaceae bacterium]